MCMFWHDENNFEVQVVFRGHAVYLSLGLIWWGTWKLKEMMDKTMKIGYYKVEFSEQKFQNLN